MILIDESVGSRDLIACPPLNDPSLACLANLSISTDTKSSVDVSFCGNGPNGKLSVGIEFKKLPDLLSSIYSGRLQSTQLVSMAKEYQICWLLYCGEYRCGDSGNLETPFTNKYTGKRSWSPVTFIGNKPLPYGYLESSLLSYSCCGVQSKHVMDISQAAHWIACLYRWWSKPWDKHKSMRTFDKSTDGKSPALMPGMDSATKQKIEQARMLPGMGFERALAAANHFKSVREMMNASVDEWLKIPGVGKVIAKSAVEAITRETTGKGKTPAPVLSSPSSSSPSDNLDVFSGD